MLHINAHCFKSLFLFSTDNNSYVGFDVLHCDLHSDWFRSLPGYSKNTDTQWKRRIKSKFVSWKKGTVVVALRFCWDVQSIALLTLRFVNSKLIQYGWNEFVQTDNPHPNQFCCWCQLPARNCENKNIGWQTVLTALEILWAAAE